MNHRARTCCVAAAVGLAVAAIGCGSRDVTDPSRPGTSPATADPAAAAAVDAFRGAVNDAPYLAGLKRLPATDIGQFLGDRPFVVRGTVTGVARADRIPDLRPDPDGSDPLLLYGVDLVVRPAPPPPAGGPPVPDADEVRVNLPLVTAQASQDLTGVDYPQLRRVLQLAPVGVEAVVLGSAPSIVADNHVRGVVAGQVFLVPAGLPTVVAIDQVAAGAVRDLSADALVERAWALAGKRVAAARPRPHRAPEAVAVGQ